jgi:cardiolipin synthase A/B
VAFVGGINLTARATGAPGHAEGHRHDAYVEVVGPAATDVHHNFVQRWNEASESMRDDGRWGHEADGETAD